MDFGAISTYVAIESLDVNKIFSVKCKTRQVVLEKKSWQYQI